MAKYEVRFTQLSRYAPMMIATRKDKCRRFEKGLHYEIRSRLTLSDLRSYKDLRAAAIRAERLLKEQERYLAARKSKRSASSHGGESRRYSEKRQRHDAPALSQEMVIVHSPQGVVTVEDRDPLHRLLPHAHIAVDHIRESVGI